MRFRYKTIVGNKKNIFIFVVNINMLKRNVEITNTYCVEIIVQ